MEAHEWMVRSTYQTEWITGRGKFLWLAMYTGGLGGGLYLVSLYFNSLIGMTIGMLIVAVLKGSFHFAYLGKPWRFWRIIMKPKTSWITRGLIFVLGFIIFAVIQIALSYFFPGTVLETLFKVLAGVMAFGVVVYTGFVLHSVKTISLWDTLLVPVIFTLWGIMGGFGLGIVVALFGGDIELHGAETGCNALLVINAFLLVIFLWKTAQRDETGKISVLDQMKGTTAPLFWTGVILFGIVIPLAIGIFTRFSGEVIPALLIAGSVFEIIGGLTMRYCMLKEGIYRPLFSRPSYLKP
jgi:sulfite dehydrogenase (quinone) subunit SoeC